MAFKPKEDGKIQFKVMIDRRFKSRLKYLKENGVMMDSIVYAGIEEVEKRLAKIKNRKSEMSHFDDIML